MKLDFNTAFLPFLTEKARFKFAFGGRGSGKSYAVGDILLYKSLEYKKNMLCTRQIQGSMTDSVQPLLSARAEQLGFVNRFKATKSELVNNVGSRFIFKGLKDSTAQNSVKSIFDINTAWVEEAQCVTQDALDLLLPSVRAKDSEIMFTYNRQADNDPVHKLFLSLADTEKRKYIIYQDKKFYWTEYRGDNMIGIKINYDGNPFFTKELELTRKLHLEKFPEDYAHFWEGEPRCTELNTILNRELIKIAMSKIGIDDGQEQVGVDVARYGNDKTVLSKRKGLKLFPLRIFSNKSVTDVAKAVMDFVNFNKEILIKVDDTGVGGGVTDILEDAGYNVIGVNNAQSAKDKDKYPNAISEMWFEFREILNLISLPKSDELCDQLGNRRYGIDAKARRFVEKKDDYKKRYGISPDLADSVLLCFYEPKIYNNTVEVW